MSLDGDYEAAKLRMMRNTTVIVGHPQRLELYALFRQAESGNCSQDEPENKDRNIIAYQKWNAWRKLQGMGSDQAKTQYIDLVVSILGSNPSYAKGGVVSASKGTVPPPQPVARNANGYNNFKLPPFKMTQKDTRQGSAPIVSINATANQRRESKASLASKSSKRSRKGKNAKPGPMVMSAQAAEQMRQFSSAAQSEAGYISTLKTNPTAALNAMRQQTSMEEPEQVYTEEMLVENEAEVDADPDADPTSNPNEIMKMGTMRSATGSEEAELPRIRKPTVAEEDHMSRQNVFRSRHFSAVAAINNPFQVEDIERKYELYEKIRAFYAKHDPERVKKGLGSLVEWALEHGEEELNKNLKQKFNADLTDIQKNESMKLQQIKEKQRRNTVEQLRMSARILAKKDPATRKKMDKLTRFLLVNDPELVSRGMYLMLKFIEAKGIGALNENLRQNYGKSLQDVSDEELNRELKSKYGNDLEMLNRPLFGDGSEDGSNEGSNANGPIPPEILQMTLGEQVKRMDKDKLKSNTQVAESKFNRQLQSANSNESIKPQPQPLNAVPTRFQSPALEKLKAAEAPEGRVDSIKAAFASPDGRSSAKPFPIQNEPTDKKLMNTLSSPAQAAFMKNEGALRLFLEKYEPYRFDGAYKVMSEFLKKNGEGELNKRLMKKYDSDLNEFLTSMPAGRPVSVNDLSDEEFAIKVLQFANKHLPDKDIERATKAMTEYRKRHGIAALNTKLYKRYGETLNDVVLEATGETRAGLSMSDIHSIGLTEDVKSKLRNFYAKYDPMILGNNGVEKIIEWAERNGRGALDRQLKKKYKESLTEFMDAERKLRLDLEQFYAKVDPAKLGTGQFEQILAWAMSNGRDALNFNLRKKYDSDLDSVLRGDRRSTVMQNSKPDI